MRRMRCRIDRYTLVHVAKSCAVVLEAEQVHAHVFKSGFESEKITQTAILTMYGLLRQLGSAQKVFDETPHRDVVIWNSLVSAYARADRPREAVRVVREMAVVGGDARPNGVTVTSVLSACSSLKALKQGKALHGYAMRSLVVGFDVFVHNALIDVYAKCSCLSYARRVFGEMGFRNSVTWTSMINGCTENGRFYEALALFEAMKSDARVRPDEATMLGIVSMAAKMGGFKTAKRINEYVTENGFAGETRIANALMDMHFKCGDTATACAMFNRMNAKERTLVTWTTVIQGLSMHGHGAAALTRFAQMQREGFKPDGVVFLSVLCACSHAGLVEEGKKWFESMVGEHGLEPWVEHYGCVVDMLCRTGRVEEAVGVVEGMRRVRPDSAVWRALLGACRERGDVGLAREIEQRLLELEPEYKGNYVMMSNMYASVGEWGGVEETRGRMVRNGGVGMGDCGCSQVEV
ncbi:putative pentatricopeptide repeat-containing protein [Acorus calamus]|uniref:Pentatricopeptide repeat-containing protein n=1 Tax=Acorus calamus TaxID=4465 RepID=A0AAV9ETF4_ACOCL|nr:putative pentatricopeptide repeat-containing protein [Acorus calamus]